MPNTKTIATAAAIAMLTTGLASAPASAQTEQAMAASRGSAAANPPPVQAVQPGQPVPWVRSIPVDLALEAATAALTACKGKHASVGVVDHNGNMIVMLVDDYATMYGQKALSQKLHAAILRQTSTQDMVNHSDGKTFPEIDWEAKIIDRFNPNALISPGAIPLLVGAQPNRHIVGALGVAGASPIGSGVHTVNEDETCARAGVAVIADRLK